MDTIRQDAGQDPVTITTETAPVPQPVTVQIDTGIPTVQEAGKEPTTKQTIQGHITKW